LLDRSRERSTDNLEAYDYYLQAMDYYNRPVSRENIRAAANLYELALAADPNFAVAAARLSTLHSRMYWYSFDRSAARLEQARIAADSATALAPDLPETHIAHGEYHYRGYLDFERAIEEFEQANAARPNDSEILFNIALVERRQAFASRDRARISASAAQIARLSELEPRNTTNAVQAAISFLVAQDFDEADRQLARARAFAPDELRPHFWSAQLALSRSGDTAAARRYLEVATRLFPEELDAQAWWHVALLRTLRPPIGELVERLSRVNIDPLVRLSSLAIQHRVEGNPDDAAIYFDSLRITATELAARQPDEAVNHGFATLAFAGLGRTGEATASSELAVQLSRIDTDLLGAADIIVLAAASAMMTGRADDAVSLLVDWAALPTWATVEWLRLDPLWQPLHSHPRFQQLVAGT
jgi:serine/threonine-protein kinase